MRWVLSWLACLSSACGRYGFSDARLHGDARDGDGDARAHDAGDTAGDSTIADDGSMIGGDSSMIGGDDAPTACAITTLIGAGSAASLSWTGSELGVAYLAGASNLPTFARVSSTGSIIGTQATLASAAAFDIDAAWNGAGWGVAWTASTGVLFTRVGTTGAEDGTEVTAVADLYASEVDLGWNGTAYLAAWGSILFDSQVGLLALDTAGATTGSDSVGTNMVTSFQPAIDWNGTAWGLVWADTKFQMSNSYDHVAFNEVSAGGLAQGGQTQISDNLNDGLGNTAALAPSLAWNGASYGVAWRDHRNAVREIYFAAIDTAGARVGVDVRVTNGTVEANEPSMIWTGSAFALAWSDDSLRVARVDTTGVRVATDVTVASAAREPALAWIGTRLAVAYTAGGSVYVALLCP